VTVPSAQSPLFVVVVTPFTELTETLHALLALQSPVLVVVVTPFTELTETLHEDKLATTTLLDTVEPPLGVPATVVSARLPEPTAEACPSATSAPNPASATSANSATALRIPPTSGRLRVPRGYALRPEMSPTKIVEPAASWPRVACGHSTDSTPYAGSSATPPDRRIRANASRNHLKIVLANGSL
jgi:hypothetical protein